MRGIRSAAQAGVRATAPVTLQRDSYRDLPGFSELAQRKTCRQSCWDPLNLALARAHSKEGPVR